LGELVFTSVEDPVVLIVVEVEVRDSGATVGCTGWKKENVFRDWKKYQKRTHVKRKENPKNKKIILMVTLVVVLGSVGSDDEIRGDVSK
jgi:hypothetical protein